MIHKCKYCNKEFKSKQLGGHTVGCKFNPNYLNRNLKIKNSLTKNRINIQTKCLNCGTIFDQIIKENGKNYIKKCCSISCSNSFATKNDNKHELKKVKCICCKKNILINKRTNKKIIRCNDCKLIEKYCKKCNKKFKTQNKNKKYCPNCVYIISDFTKNKLRIARLKSIENGNIGFGIHCKFEDIKCDSGLEYAFCKWYKQHHPLAKIKRFIGFIEYKDMKYKPDFLIDNKIIVEVKYNKMGYELNKKWKYYLESQSIKKEALKHYSNLKKYDTPLWITNEMIGNNFYRKCLNEIKTLV